MTQEQFKELLRKYRENTCTEEERKIVDEWYASIGTGEDFSLTEEEEQRLEARYWSVLQGHIQRSKRLAEAQAGTASGKSRTVFALRYVGMAAAAAAVLALVVGIWQSSGRHPAGDSNLPDAGASGKWVSNNSGKPMEVVLPDSSKVVLEDSGKIYYAQAFVASRREVRLRGAAFFDVIHDAQHPFVVYSGEVTTLVQGTSFSVTARDGGKDITVAVRTGKVSVMVDKEKTGPSKEQMETVLTPNQQFVYNRMQHVAAKTLIALPQPVVPMEKVRRLHFDGAPVADIFQSLEEVYGVKIVFDEHAFKNCVLTTSTSDGTIFERIDIICKAIGASYTIENAAIYIHGSGCN